MLLVATPQLSEFTKQMQGLVVKYLGWGDFDLGLDFPPSCPTSNYTAISAKFPSAQAEQSIESEQWNDRNQRPKS